ncbi:unnamed protein product [Cyprideis torosa]|uniref:Uncharacterized protein n=1 Tax=Cyprideis torosa TaxID=163714 RepID=A0A7R8ZIA7_9CRUS|nr:unnamed protein product [Cyprideis torosa]CAG0884376.1 unnamed protein product [Cyprideis torosa]
MFEIVSVLGTWSLLTAILTLTAALSECYQILANISINVLVFFRLENAELRRHLAASYELLWTHKSSKTLAAVSREREQNVHLIISLCGVSQLPLRYPVQWAAVCRDYARILCLCVAASESCTSLFMSTNLRHHPDALNPSSADSIDCASSAECLINRAP